MIQSEIKKFQINLFSCISQLVAFFIIGRIIGERGVTYLAITLEVFFVILALINGGFTECLGGLLASRKEKTQYKNMERMRRCALHLQLITGVVFGALLFGMADVLAIHLFRTSSMAFLFRLVAVFIPIRQLSSAYLGFYKGEGRPYDSSFTRMFRAALTLVLTIILAGTLGNYGDKVGAILNQKHIGSMYESVAVVLAMLITEVFVLVSLVIIYEKRIKERVSLREGMKLTESKRQCMFLLFRKRLPQMIAEVIMLLPLIMAFLYWDSFSAKMDGFLIYGAFVGEFGFLVLLLAMAHFVLLLPLLHTMIGNLQKKEMRPARTQFHLAVHSCIANGVFAVVFMTVMAPQLAAVFTPSAAKVLEKLLSSCSTAALVVTVGVFLFFFLKEIGAQRKALIVLGGAALLYTIGIVVVLLMKKPMTLFPAVWALCCLFLGCAGLWKLSFRYMRARLDLIGALVIPVGVGCAVGLVCMLFGRVFTPHLDELFTLIMTLIVALLLYWFLLLMLRNFREKELNHLPGGKIIRFYGKLLRIF